MEHLHIFRYACCFEAGEYRGSVWHLSVVRSFVSVLCNEWLCEDGTNTATGNSSAKYVQPSIRYVLFVKLFSGMFGAGVFLHTEYAFAGVSVEKLNTQQRLLRVFQRTANLQYLGISFSCVLVVV